VSVDHGGATVWQWQIHGRRGEVRAVGKLSVRGTPEEQHELAERFAAEKLALLMWDAEPEWERLAGWRVRVWCGDVEVVSCADEWLEMLRRGVLARKRDRLDLLPVRSRKA
jgi:hypothetical protein